MNNENPIKIEYSLMPAVCFAMQQNHIPFLKNVVIKNDSDVPLKGVSFDISFEPAFASAFSLSIEEIAARSSVEVSPLHILLSTDYLFSVTEAVWGRVTLRVSDDSRTYCEKNAEIKILSYDQWLGSAVTPELTASYVTPNHPKITQILANASVYMNKWTGSPSLTGYQTNNPNNVKMQLAAIYAALQQENIAYTMPPASYETVGQKVRLADTVLEQKMGTCIDLSLLYASCIEAANLHPLIILKEGHAFCGCWLENETFPECIVYDASSITKRTADGINQLILVECTDFIAKRNVDFDNAVLHASEDMKKADEFEMAIDIRRCRSSRICPMPTRVMENGVFKAVEYGERRESETTSAPKEISRISDTELADVEVTKQVIWERKLLDLNLRNSLLNFRATSSVVQLMAPDLAQLEDEISNGEAFRLMPIPQELSFNARDAKIFEIENSKDMLSSLAQTEFKSHRLRTFLSDEDLQKNIKKLHRTAKLSIEENGANTLYLALGFLKWYESDKSEKARLAPLILMPVDIVRKLADKSYSLRLRDEDVQINITLLEMLRQEFGINIKGLNPPPCDESGVNIPLIFSTVRQAVMPKNRWDIVEYAFIGQFSFSRFIMWNDIKNRSEELAQNKTVASLISGKLEWEPPMLDKNPHELDETVMPSDMAVPMSTDSSQLSAIYQASNGQSFVLHGPPGTGKSQTITNMIANALYQGKTVLFVAEKMAALSVVQKRLSKIGLGPFCLEIHSNKAQKRAVLSQLENTINTAHTKPAEEHAATAQRLYEIRSSLNEVMREIHKTRSFGFSLYEAVSRYESSIDFDGRLDIPSSLIECDSDSFAKLKDSVHNAAVSLQGVGVCADKLCDYHNRSYSFEIRDNLGTLLSEYEKSLDSLAPAITQLKAKTGFDITAYNDYSLLSRAVGMADAASILLPAVLSDSRFGLVKENIDKLISTVESAQALKAEIDTGFDNAIYGFDAQKAMLEYKASSQKWFLPRAIDQSKAVKELKIYSKGIDITKENITGYYEKLITYAGYINELNSAPENVTMFVSDIWAKEQTNLALLRDAYQNSCNLRELLAGLGIDNVQRGNIAQRLSEMCVNANSETAALMEFSNKFTELLSIESKLKSAFINLDGIHAQSDWLTFAKTRIDALREGIPSLREWSAFLVCCDELDTLGLSCVKEKLSDSTLSPSDADNAFVCNFCKTAAGSIISSTPALSSFRGDAFDDTIKKYEETISQYEQLTVQELVARLSSRIPTASSGIAASSEISILQKAIKSGGRMLPIRKLFDSIPNLLRKICPCMLMSPISVAQYIDPAFPKFDLVIFDEASQMPTCEAVGSIARGENVIVVGDPKQLPPTSFFSANQFDEENSDKEDLESVLDDCLALMMPSRHLLWHYRSRHESLIAYSNAKFYENKLYTFPSPDDLVSEVKLVKCGGYYDRSSTKQNKAEAQAVVDEIIRRLRDEKLRKLSIGVVTFSIVQQHLIDDMLYDALAADAELEQIAHDMYEPIFIKNLENVQGDERDVILFSVGYGPDKNGKISMNFGPINKDGGWRRLNVAISRSRRQMIVFSTITPEQIDLSRTSSEGVAGLKGFLEFAARGKAALNLPASQSSKQENGFVIHIAKEIEKLGYKTVCNIGTSEYKIDIGIVNPNNEGTYILGIMCDSKQHFENSSARDRHISQPSVLKGLGWNVMSVYSLDWLDNSTKVLEKIRSAIETAVANDGKEKTVEEPKPKTELKFETVEENALQPEFTRYKEYKPMDYGTSENFYDEGSDKKIRTILEETIRLESPVSEKALYRRVLSGWGMTRGGSKVNDAIAAQLNTLPIMATSASYNTFYWKADMMPSDYKDFRVPESDDEKRSFEDIAPQEISNCVEFLLRNQLGMTRHDLIRQVAKIFGYTRLGSAIETAVNEGIECALFKGICEENADKIIYKEK